jgi:hypothetical protein
MPTKTSVGPNEVVRLEVLRLAPPLVVLRGLVQHLAVNQMIQPRRSPGGGGGLLHLVGPRDWHPVPLAAAGVFEGNNVRLLLLVCFDMG